MSTPEIRELESKLRRLKKAERKEKAKSLGHPRRKGIGCRDRDEELKRLRGYADPSTYVRRDGSEKLVGEDWHNRKMQLIVRADAKCERYSILGRIHAAGCNRSTDFDPHHIIKRSVRRDDRLENLAWLSRPCHDAEDERKIRSDKAEHRAAERREQA